jgi:hypothetical protein
MYCSGCGSSFSVSDKFCSKCGTAVSAIHLQPEQETSSIKVGGNGMAKQLSKTVFILLILVSTFVVTLIFSEMGIGTVLLSISIAETVAATAVGFSVAKSITKNYRRTWVEIIWFHVINLVGCIISLALVGAVPMKALVAMAFALMASGLLFWLQNKSRSASK